MIVFLTRRIYDYMLNVAYVKKTPNAQSIFLCKPDMVSPAKMGGTAKFILENATVNQTKILRNIDQTFKNVYKKKKQNMNNLYTM